MLDRGKAASPRSGVSLKTNQAMTLLEPWCRYILVRNIVHTVDTGRVNVPTQNGHQIGGLLNAGQKGFCRGVIPRERPLFSAFRLPVSIRPCAPIRIAAEWFSRTICPDRWNAQGNVYQQNDGHAAGNLFLIKCQLLIVHLVSRVVDHQNRTPLISIDEACGSCPA